jgi:multidrug transporter EmrE-like cation transporter
MKWILLAIIVTATVLGDLLQSSEMKRAGKQSVSARGLLKVMRTIASRSHLILAVVCMAVSFFAFMALVQTAPLSFAVPATAGTLVLETALARMVLKEKVCWRRATGAALVLGGIIVIGH